LPQGTRPFAVFAAVARSPRWELKRRLAEALPALLAIDATWTVPLMEALRDDPPDPENRTDIRRRVLEALPALWRIRPGAVPPLLRWREGDEVYAVLGSLDALAEIQASDGQAEALAEIRAELLEQTESEHQEAARLYAAILERIVTNPDAAIRTIHHYLLDEDRLTRICLARSLQRVLPARPAETLKLMRHFLRQENGRPAEHQNVRRAVARHPVGLIELLGEPEGVWRPYEDDALDLLHALAADQDVHIRRALCDVLSSLLRRAPEVALDLIESHLLQDRDHFVQERTWNALRQLMSGGSERAEDLCARLIEIA
jgi:ketosteroid isomerase-like protein